ncbi:hypothetical protein E6P09_15335 (plasmid) [Haloferax mediterranei ATCC 33500]|uniref:Uncharacterized protein n=1 Tax=Haloferax mediterranei (strain ATCC 33500 / DSM 1411 / JCM 8866 / NBRC 14739 / NCIMB 2177 / R-4) TaxID=523841 RepID=I3RAB1_HALMT|nr:hypothetical protein HFX_6044 [Haloferax mediterranei ATCC 33500]QCQ76716.1 hypothetical protein E6P09_15335 [Haloferax mediterranei ATCC 33500]
MNAHNKHTYRDQQTVTAAQAQQIPKPASVNVERRSIRVSLDRLSTHRCDYCGEEIEEKTRYRNVTVRDSNGEISDYAFCTEACSTSCFGGR